MSTVARIVPRAMPRASCAATKTSFQSRASCRLQLGQIKVRSSAVANQSAGGESQVKGNGARPGSLSHSACRRLLRPCGTGAAGRFTP